jgi:hypothetical protein
MDKAVCRFFSAISDGMVAYLTKTPYGFILLEVLINYFLTNKSSNFSPVALLILRHK